MSADLTGWAVVLPPSYTGRSPQTVVVEIGPNVTEERAWTVALGWPSKDEVLDAKARGARAFRCKIVENKEP